jgi:ligand-binding sensor domain-containing protein/serine phosphatase RsbU (regulator of sigma subunit)
VYGYLWVGTDNGLFRYNGFKFENFPVADSLADNFISCTVSNGKDLWFGYRNGRLSYFNGKKLISFNLSQPGSNSITHFAKSPDDKIWASTYSDGLLLIKNDTTVLKRYKFRDQITIKSFDFLTDNELLVGTNTGILYCTLKDSGEIEVTRSVPEIPESNITSIFKKKDKSGFYITTENDGIFQLTTENNQLKIGKLVADNSFEFTGIQDIYEDSESYLWLCSKEKGLIRMSHSVSGELTRIIFFNKAGGFISDNVKTIFEDREGNIWSGNFGQGLTLVTPKTFSVSNIDNPVYGNNIFSISLQKRFRWIGTENGLIKMDQESGKIIKFYTKKNGLPKDTVTAIYSLNGNDLWIGTARNGVFRMDTVHDKILRYPVDSGVLENSVTTITGMGEQLWIGTKKGLWNINATTDKITRYSINEGGLPHNSINCLFIDRTGKVWVTTPGSTLAYIQEGKVFKIPLTSVIGNLTLGPVTEDTYSRIWVGSKGNGVFMIQSDSAANLSIKEGLLSGFCYSLVCDDQDNIWVGHKGGLSRIRTTDFSVKPFRHIEELTDNFQFNPNAIVKSQLGKIWFGSDKGIVSYDPSMEDHRIVPPVLGITTLKINDTEIEVSDRIILSPGNYKIRIDYLGINLKEPALVNYQYKLEGYDQWSDVTKNTSVTYNHLTEGEYTFILKCSSGDGAVSENPLSISFLINKPLWEEWWFFPVALLFIGTIGFILIKRREYKFVEEKRILEEKVRERTYEIQSQKNEIEIQRDEIDEKNARITSSIKYASHIQNSILPPPELIDRLLPDNFILNMPKDIVSGDFYWLTEKNNKIVFTVADCTGHGVPGAFMSLLGITFLNEIVNIEGITKSVDIVNRLREKVIYSLQQGRRDIPTSDGMDIALCVLDLQNNTLQFTGGMNNIIHITNGKLEVIRADRTSVCVLYAKDASFTMKEFEIRKGDMLYLFTDGYQDQFGGDHDRKYFAHRFYCVLLDIHRLPMLKQKEILEKNLRDWKKDNIQTDDIIVMGIRL